MKRCIFLIALLLLIAAMIGCSSESDESSPSVTYYTVTFKDTDGITVSTERIRSDAIGGGYAYLIKLATN